MTTTLDGKTLNVSRFIETASPVKFEWDVWEAEQYKRKVTTYGVVKKWFLECFEDNVAWADSAANHFQGKIGDIVNLTVSEGTLHQVNTNVYVLDVQVIYDKRAAGKHRVFTIELQEA